MEQHPSLRQQTAQRITLLGLIKNIFLAIIKMVFGIVGQSQALVADGLHSIADLLTDAIVLVAAKYGSHDADKNHPYGHQRIETAATVALAVLLMLTGAFIIVDTIQDLVKTQHSVPKPIVLWVAIGSALLNEILFQLTQRIGNKIRSNLLLANAWHHRSDAASSLIVAIGVAGALLGYAYLDTIAALLVGILIIKMGVELAWSSIQELVDTGVDEETLSNMRQIISSVAGVISIHQLRNRAMGGAIYVDVHIQVDPYLSVSEGHYIALQVHQTLMQKMPEVTDVTVHIDPEDDGVAAPCASLPNRQQIIDRLTAAWADLPESRQIQQVELHYLSGKATVELKLPLATLEQGKTAQQLTQAFRQAITPEMGITQIELWFG